jgi:SPP1 gp7 family putative phage head morphogenesis protein
MSNIIVNGFKTHIKNPQDPANILRLQLKYERALLKKFTDIEKIIKYAIVDRDVFGLNEQFAIMQLTPPPQRAFSFDTNTKKIQAFIEWLNSLINEDLLRLGTMADIGNVNEFWGNVYIFESYQRGVQDIRFDLKQQGIYDFMDIDAVMHAPVHLNRVAQMFLRNYENLKGITSDMGKQLSTALSEGFINGLWPRDIAKNLVELIEKGKMSDIAIKDKIGRTISTKNRASLLARTECIAAHVNGAVEECLRMGYEKGQVYAEYIAGYDDRVCDECSRLHLQVFTLEEIRGLIPMHPRCRCTFVPIVK